MMQVQKFCRVISLIILFSFCKIGKAQTKPVHIIGAMRNVMWKGQLYGTINLDTIANRKYLYGFGPVEYLKGELLVIDGHAYKAMVLTDHAMRVNETYKVKAPFFAYANISHWKKVALPDTVQSIQQLESYLFQSSKKTNQPFLFKVIGTVETATIHVVNLPQGTKVSSPDDAHKGQTNFELNNEQVDIIGFFSTKHKAIFTHHDTYLHMHLITKSRTKMGHLDKAVFKKGDIELYLPE